MGSNRKTVHEALSSVLASAPSLIVPRLTQVALQLVNDAITNRGYQSFTGNTITSLAVGIFVNQRLDTAICSRDELKSPVMVKIQKGQAVYLEYPYEGEARWMRGAVETDQKYGFETSINFLNAFKPQNKYPISLVMTTGTEYAEYLEDARGLNVLTDTYLNLQQILYSNL